MSKLTPTTRSFLEAVQRGEVVQDRRNNPYKTYVGSSTRAVSRTVLDAVQGLTQLNLATTGAWEVPWVLTSAGEQALSEQS